MLDLESRHVPGSFADLLQVRPHHLRSVALERDYQDPSSTLHYVVTPFVEETLQRLARSFAPRSTERSWRLTGDYGSGKSSLALAYARLGSGNLNAFPDRLHPLVSQERLEPVLVVGEREPIAKSLMRAILATALRCGVAQPFSSRSMSSQEVLAALDALGDELRDRGHAKGLMIVFDELGKNLEHAAQRTDADDVYLLQLIAEKAARSGERALVVVAILHQAVASYAVGLPSILRREWEKVASRYEEVVFAPPIEQTATLIGAALDVDLGGMPNRVAKEARETMLAALQMGWFGFGAANGGLETLAPSLLPLDPTTVPVLARALRRFGQNERSLFSFLSSSEPYGLMEHARQPVSTFEPFRLHHLYDYLASNLSSVLSSGAQASRWSLIEDILTSAEGLPLVERNVLKTVALLNLLDASHLTATHEAVMLAVAGADRAGRALVAEAIENLTERSRVLYDRGASGALCLWPNTSVDLDEAFARASDTVRTGGSGIDAVRSLLPADPLVARRHYVQTGTLRHFDVHYIPAARAVVSLSAEEMTTSAASDGRVVVVLSENARERDEILEKLAHIAGLPENLIVGIPQPIGSLAPQLSDVAAWRWVRDHVAELSGDRIARNEVNRQLALAEGRLARSMDAALDIRGSAASSIVWLHQGRRRHIASGRLLTAWLSDICDSAFSKSPLVRNELINRRSLSSAAARARFLLIECLATAADKPKLGLDKGGSPPELAIYSSVLQSGNVHAERNGAWRIQMPPEGEDPLRLRPALLRIGELLREAKDRPVPFEQVSQALRDEKYSVRDGLIPLIIAIYIAANWHRTAVYEDGTYLDQVGGPEFNRIVKEPEHFQLQHCAIEGVRAEVFSKLAAVVGVTGTERPEVLDIVRPLITFLARLPDHARRTRQLSLTTATARAALLAGVDPTSLIFRSLPEAVGLEPIEAEGKLDTAKVDGFVREITRVVRELREAYPSLLTRIASSLGASLDASTSLSSLRAETTVRAERVQSTLSEPELKAFVARLSDRGLEDQTWLESVASYVARKPPERWADADEADFHHRLPILARRFRHVEAMHFPGADEDESAYRLLLTAADGHEVERIYRLSPEERQEMAAVEIRMREVLVQEGRMGRLAAIRLLLELQEMD